MQVGNEIESRESSTAELVYDQRQAAPIINSVGEKLQNMKHNDDSALRLFGALPAEKNEVWQERRYRDMDEFVQWDAERATTGDGNIVVAITG